MPSVHKNHIKQTASLLTLIFIFSVPSLGWAVDGHIVTQKLEIPLEQETTYNLNWAEGGRSLVLKINNPVESIEEIAKDWVGPLVLRVNAESRIGKKARIILHFPTVTPQITHSRTFSPPQLTIQIKAVLEGSDIAYKILEPKYIAREATLYLYFPVSKSFLRKMDISSESNKTLANALTAWEVGQFGLAETLLRSHMEIYGMNVPQELKAMLAHLLFDRVLQEDVDSFAVRKELMEIYQQVKNSEMSSNILILISQLLRYDGLSDQAEKVLARAVGGSDDEYRQKFLLLLAMTLFDQGKVVEGKRMLNAVGDYQDKEFLISKCYVISWAEYLEGNIKKATNDVLACEPDSNLSSKKAGSWFFRAEMLARSGAWEKADREYFSVFNHVKRQNSLLFSVISSYAGLLVTLNRREEAETWLDQGIEVANDSEWGRFLFMNRQMITNGAKIESELTRYLADRNDLFNHFQIKAALMLVSYYDSLGKNLKAVSLLRNILAAPQGRNYRQQCQDRFERIFLNYYKSLLAQGKYREFTNQNLTREWGQFSDRFRSRVMFLSSDAYREIGLTRRSAELLQEVLKRDLDDTTKRMVLRKLYQTYLEADDYFRARKTIEYFGATFPTSGQDRYFVNRALAEISDRKDDIPKQIVSLSQSLEDAPNDKVRSKIYFKLGLLNYLNENPKQCLENLKQYQKLLELDETPIADAIFTQAYCADELRNLEETVMALKVAIEHWPDDPRASLLRFRLVEILLESGAKAKAIEQINQLSKDSDPFWQEVGDFYMKREQWRGQHKELFTTN